MQQQQQQRLLRRFFLGNPVWLWLWMAAASICKTSFRFAVLGPSFLPQQQQQQQHADAFALVRGPRTVSSLRHRNDFCPERRNGGGPFLLFQESEGMRHEAKGSTENDAPDTASAVMGIEYNETTTSTSTTTTTTNAAATVTTATATATATTTKGYRRIEEWHEEQHDSKHVIRHLKQEKARWAKTFDELS